MSFSNCFKFDKEFFNSATTVFCSRRSLVIFLLNVILNIKVMWKDLCCCKTPYERCLVCQARICYPNYEYDKFENCFNFDFLAKVQENVRKNLLRLLTAENHFGCKVINCKYMYSHKDWFCGRVDKIYISDCLRNYENKKIDKIKARKCKVFIKPLKKLS